jgi:rare lipoprotein A
MRWRNLELHCVATRVAVLGLPMALMAGCGAPGERAVPAMPYPDVAAIPDAVPRAEPPSPYGNPRSYRVNGRRYYTRATARGYAERGIASWYGPKFHGRRTSSGERYDMYAMTAAHRTLPLPSYVQVTNLENGRQVIVRVNDRGPFRRDRIIDLSYAAAAKLHMVGRGTAPVEVRAIDPSAPGPPAGAYAGPQPSAKEPAGGVYVQAGAFSQIANAHRLQARLYSLVNGVVRIEEAVSGDATIYRVRVGPLAGVEEAERVTQTLSASGLRDLRVVAE